MKCLVFIPVRLESKRFPNKILKNIHNIPMVEHVRRRALIANVFKKVYLVTNSLIIKNKLNKYGANVLLTFKRHSNGTSRVSEISKKFKFNYAFILFGDEPFVNPDHLRLIIKKIKKNNKCSVFNVTTNLKKDDLNSREVVKTIINKKNDIIDYFRLSKINLREETKIRKSSGIIILKRRLLNNYRNLKVNKKEKKNKIEQFRFLENNIKIKSIFIKNIRPSVNTKKELYDLLSSIKNDKKEKKMINKIRNFEY